MFFFGWILKFFTSVIKHFIRLSFAQLLNKFGRFCKELTAEKIEFTSYSLTRMKIPLALASHSIMFWNLSVNCYQPLKFVLVKSVFPYDIVLSPLLNSLSLFIQDLGRLFCPKKYVGGRHFIKQVQEKQTRKSFSGGSEYPWSLRGKLTYFSGSKFFGCFEKHPKVVSGALRDGFRAREVFGSFEKRTPAAPYH